MSEPLEPGSIDARPDAGIFNVIRHLNYKPQYAFAEYIDNSISSFEENKEALLELDSDYKLRIDIEVGPEEIRIKDNAGGIPRDQYARAFKTAERPLDPKKGLNEFGMGMKTASIWLSSHWTVISSALEENQTGTVVFDVQQMIDTKTTIIKPTWKTKPNARHHGTTIILKELNRRIASLPAIKQHLGEIYRGYLRSKLVDIRIYRTGDSENDPESIVTFEEMKPLLAKAAYPNGPKGDVTWKKDVKFTLPGGQTVSGTAMVLEKGSTDNSTAITMPSPWAVAVGGSQWLNAALTTRLTPKCSTNTEYEMRARAPMASRRGPSGPCIQTLGTAASTLAVKQASSRRSRVSTHQAKVPSASRPSAVGHATPPACIRASAANTPMP